MLTGADFASGVMQMVTSSFGVPGWAPPTPPQSWLAAPQRSSVRSAGSSGACSAAGTATAAVGCAGSAAGQCLTGLALRWRRVSKGLIPALLLPCWEGLAQVLGTGGVLEPSAWKELTGAGSSSAAPRGSTELEEVGCFGIRKFLTYPDCWCWNWGLS